MHSRLWGVTFSQSADTPSDAVWTVPNAISMARIGLIGAFLYFLVADQDVWALVTLVAAGVSDFLDGYLARRWNQSTALGRLLDPLADRLLTVAVVVGFAVRGIIPWWLLAVLLARDAVVAIALWWGHRAHVAMPEVTRVGKLATLLLYLFLPLAYLAFNRWDSIHDVAIIGTVTATAVYWWAGGQYIQDIRRRVAQSLTASAREPHDA